MGRYIGLLAIALLSGCAQRPTPVQDGQTSSKPVIHVKDQVFVVTGDGVAKIGNPAEHFSVHVMGPGGPSEVAMVGDYAKEKDRLTFKPRYPLDAGVRYQAVFRASKQAEPVIQEIALPKPKVESTTVVEHVYPSGSVLPENLLRFYIHFSAPMERGSIYQHVHLIDDKGKEIEMPFLELDEEFWDREQKRFTLFFDPGRIKRGLKPREDLGPALEENRSYRLVIDKNLLDARGAPLKEAHTKPFKVVAPDDLSPDPKTWKIEPAAAGSSDALTVVFSKPLDHSLLQRLMTVLDADGQRLPGRITVSGEETRWHFQPEKPWSAGAYQVLVKTTLEDRCGNSIERPFEIDVFNAVQKKIESGELKLPFQVK